MEFLGSLFLCVNGILFVCVNLLTVVLNIFFRYLCLFFSIGLFCNGPAFINVADGNKNDLLWWGFFAFIVWKPNALPRCFAFALDVILELRYIVRSLNYLYGGGCWHWIYGKGILILCILTNTMKRMLTVETRCVFLVFSNPSLTNCVRFLIVNIQSAHDFCKNKVPFLFVGSIYCFLDISNHFKGVTSGLCFSSFYGRGLRTQWKGNQQTQQSTMMSAIVVLRKRNCLQCKGFHPHISLFGTCKFCCQERKPLTFTCEKGQRRTKGRKERHKTKSYQWGGKVNRLKWRGRKRFWEHQ